MGKRDKRIEVIHKTNGGLSDARNVGLNYAKGHFICFVDSDDILDKHYIEWLHEAICTSNTKMAACDIQCFYDGDIIKTLNTKQSYKVYSSEEALNQILHGEGVRAIACNNFIGQTFLEGRNLCMVSSMKMNFLHIELLIRQKN